MSGEKTFVRKINRRWVMVMEMVPATFFLLGFLLIVTGAFIDERIRNVGFACLIFTVSIAIVQTELFYRLIRCPQCRCNLVRFKNGKRMPVKIAWKKLGKMTCCSQCGFTGDDSQ